CSSSSPTGPAAAGMSTREKSRSLAFGCSSGRATTHSALPTMSSSFRKPRRAMRARSSSAFPDASGVAVDAELVRSEHDTMRGLMYRKSLGAERGMLFDLSVRDDHKFWMHNTCIPLD